jgi:hypothetical protein
MEEDPSEMNIWIAASNGDLARVQEYLAADPSAANAQDEFGYTPLLAAVTYGHQELIQFLLDSGADLGNTDK